MDKCLCCFKFKLLFQLLIRSRVYRSFDKIFLNLKLIFVNGQSTNSALSGSMRQSDQYVTQFWIKFLSYKDVNVIWKFYGLKLFSQYVILQWQLTSLLMGIYIFAHGILHLCTWQFTSLHMVIYIFAHDNLHLCSWQFTSLQMAIYILSHANLHLCSCQFTSLLMPIYIFAHANLHICSWQFTSLLMAIYIFAYGN